MFQKYPTNKSEEFSRSGLSLSNRKRILTKQLFQPTSLSIVNGSSNQPMKSQSGNLPKEKQIGLQINLPQQQTQQKMNIQAPPPSSISSSMNQSYLQMQKMQGSNGQQNFFSSSQEMKTKKKEEKEKVNENSLKFLIDAGIERKKAIDLLKKTNNSVERAMELFFNPPPKQPQRQQEQVQQNVQSSLRQPLLRQQGSGQSIRTGYSTVDRLNQSMIMPNSQGRNLYAVNSQNQNSSQLNKTISYPPSKIHKKPSYPPINPNLINPVSSKHQRTHSQPQQRQQMQQMQRQRQQNNQFIRKPQPLVKYNKPCLLQTIFGGYFICVNKNYLAKMNPLILGSNKTEWIFTPDGFIQSKSSDKFVFTFGGKNCGQNVYVDFKDKNNKNQRWLLKKKMTKDGINYVLLIPYYNQGFCLDTRNNQIVLNAIYNSPDLNQTWVVCQ